MKDIHIAAVRFQTRNSMIFEPYGEIIAECSSGYDEAVVAYCTAEKLRLAGGTPYRNARRPDLC